MAFYISPPKGNVPLQRLQSYCRKRMAFLKEVFARGRDLKKLSELTSLVSTVEGSDCLIEGSTKDQVSHFTLRLACCTDSVMSHFLLEAETTLFWYRFSCMGEKELLHLFRRIRKYERNLHGQQPGKSRRAEKKFLDLLEFLTNLCKNGHQWKDVVECYLCHTCSERKNPAETSANQFKPDQSGYRENLPTHDTHCVEGQQSYMYHKNVASDYTVKTQQGEVQCKTHCTDSEEKIFLQVPFQYVLELVSDRRVCLHKGFAYVPCVFLPDVFASVFKQCLRIGIELAREALPNVLGESRMQEMFRLLRLQFYEDGCHGDEERGVVFDAIGRHEVDRLVELFPPCMSHLHRTLRQRHRLKHFSRLQYTLFLKELGLPVHEAVQFWQQEYSRPHCGDGCTHHWGRDGRRYTYNIRHLYGLEGSRVNYRSHCCQGIQERILQPGEEGGCPFKHFDQKHLQQLLIAEGVSPVVQQGLASMAANHNPRQACRAYLLHKLETRLEAFAGGGHCKCEAQSSESGGNVGMSNTGVKTETSSNNSLENGDILENDRTVALPVTSSTSAILVSPRDTYIPPPFKQPRLDNVQTVQTKGFVEAKEESGIVCHEEQGKTPVDAGSTSETCQECGRQGSDWFSGPSRQDQCFVRTVCSDLAIASPKKRTLCPMCSVSIRKPLDFTRAFVKLLEGLKSQSTM